MQCPDSCKMIDTGKKIFYFMVTNRGRVANKVCGSKKLLPASEMTTARGPNRSHVQQPKAIKISRKKGLLALDFTETAE